MKLYLSKEPHKKLKHAFSNLSAFCVIDIDTIISESKLDMSKKSSQYLVNSEIEHMLKTNARSKRYIGIIYINSNLNCDIIESLRCFVNDTLENYIDGLALLDDYDLPRLKQYYGLFDEIVFFPRFKKIKIVESRHFNEIKKEN